jgi:BASS family bile acid:Na+ symporter
MAWSRKIANLFWLWTIIGTLWAWFIPGSFTWFVTETVPFTSIKLTAVGLGIIMLGMGLTLSFDDLKRALGMPRAALIGIVAQFRF